MNNNPNISDSDLSPISDFYCGKTVFLTGVTGFLGECFVVKLLRIGVKDVYVLIRQRRNMSSQERFNKLLQSPIFEPLRKERPNFAEHIIPISGSLDELELDISQDVQNILFKNVQIVVHCAADIRFDVPIAAAAMRNIRGTREILKLARKIEKLENFIHISTAYSYCMRNVIGEDFYAPPLDSDLIIQIVENMTSEKNLDVLEATCEKIIKPWPNTYTFSKAIMEDLVRQYTKHFKITVIRPSIVTATFREPIEGWASNFAGANEVFAGIVGGVLRCLKLNEGSAIDMVFGDYVINGALAAAFEVSTVGNVDPPIYNIVSSNDYVKTFDRMVKEILPFRNRTVPSKALWFPMFNFCHNHISHFLYNMVLHVIPAVIFDIILRIMGKKPRILQLYRQIHSFGGVINFFISSTFKFQNNNIKGVIKNMTSRDKQIFFCDFGEVRWMDYVDVYIYKGTITHLLRDQPDRQKMQQNARRMKLIHYSFVLFLGCCTLFLFYVVIKQIFYKAT